MERNPHRRGRGGGGSGGVSVRRGRGAQKPQRFPMEGIEVVAEGDDAGDVDADAAVAVCIVCISISRVLHYLAASRAHVRTSTHSSIQIHL